MTRVLCLRCETAFDDQRCRNSINAATVSDAARRSALADLDAGYCPICHLLLTIKAARIAANHETRKELAS